jgi:hypothetical protein
MPNSQPIARKESTPSEKAEIKTIKNIIANLDGTREKTLLSPAGRDRENCWDKALLLMLALCP